MQANKRLLHDMFPALEGELIDNIYEQCKQDLDAAINFLLELSSSSNNEVPQQNEGNDTPSPAAAPLPERFRNMNQYGFVVREDDKARSTQEKESEGYVNASYWSGSNSYAYDAPFFRGEGKSDSTSSDDFEDIIAHLERKYGPGSADEREQEREREREQERQRQREREEERAREREREWDRLMEEDRRKQREREQKWQERVREVETQTSSPLRGSSPGRLGEQMSKEADKNDDSHRWKCEECSHLNALKRFSCESCFSLRGTSETVKVEKQETKDDSSGTSTPKLGRGKFVFQDGRYRYVEKGGDEQTSKEEDGAGRYSFSYTNNKFSQTEEQPGNEKEREQQQPQQQQQQQQQQETGEGSHFKFGKYVFVGGRYVYVKDGEKPPTAEDVYAENYLKRKAEEQRRTAAGVPSHPYYTENSLNEAAKVSWMLSCNNHYTLLGVSRNASLNDIKASYKKLALLLHPDRNNTPGSEEAFKALSEAFTCLSNPETRRKYDVSHPDIYHYASTPTFNSRNTGATGGTPFATPPMPSASTTSTTTNMSEEELLGAFIFLRSMLNPFNSMNGGRKL